LVVAGLTGGWFLAQQFESPAQREAKAAAPTASSITAEVRRGDLSDSITVNAEVSRQLAQHLSLNGPTSPTVVTGGFLDAGTLITAGTRLSEVNGRPIFAFPGAFPFYRDLTEGATGPDVLQLQKGLTAAGFRVDADGSFGAGTVRAIKSLYKKAGYTAPAADASETTVPTTGVPATGDTAPSATGVTAPSPSPTAVISVPRVELAVFSALPAQLVSSPAVGTIVAETDEMVLESGPLEATATVAAGSVTALASGMAATLTDSTGAVANATISAIGAADKDGNVTVHVTASGTAIPDSWLHSSVLATIVRSVAAKDSLIVPTRSVVTSADGSAHLLKRRADGSFLIVQVKELGALNGQSAVEALEPGSLGARDLVKVK
jgi:peptidoglycan hydrolase-like protein with peptidoglycan-binding domain